MELALAPAAVLQILNVGGRVVVSACDGDEALLTITREVAQRGSAMDWVLRRIGRDRDADSSGAAPIVRSNARGVQVSTVGIALTDGPVVNYTIDVKLPRGRGLEASNGNGPITIAGVEGDVTANSENGDVRCEAIMGRVAASVRNGNVLCRFVSGAIDVNAANGSVEIEHEGAVDESPVRVWTTNGPIRFYGGNSAINLRAQTENGRIVGRTHAADAECRKTLRTLDLHSDNGDAEVELHALNGNIYVDAI
jgi:hypothetical protein